MFLAPTPIHFHEGISDRQDVHFERPERTHPLRQSRLSRVFSFFAVGVFCEIIKFILRGDEGHSCLVGPNFSKKDNTLRKVSRARHRVVMTPELLLEVFRISWAKERARKEQKKRSEIVGAEQQQNLRKEQNSDSDSEVNITDEALIAANAVMDSFLKEVVHRAAAAAVEDGETLVTEVHLERVLPQLLLDFTS